jgi:hypothetical protein
LARKATDVLILGEKYPNIHFISEIFATTRPESAKAGPLQVKQAETEVKVDWDLSASN